jgi:hypothetical protein
MSYQHRQRTIQFSLIIFCCLFVAVTRAEVSINCQGCTCIVGNLAPPPKSSWYANQQVAVRIDDAWTDVERAYFQQGIEKWNQANNCSGVLFHDFRPLHFTNYDFTVAPQTSRSGGLDPGLWESECFLLSPESQARLRSAIVPIIPEFNNQNPPMHFVYLGTHELGHTFDLHDCLFGNGCTICSAGNCSIREAWVEAVARHNLRL